MDGIGGDGDKFAAVKDTTLSATSIHAILDDGEMHLWFATANGIARCDCTMTADCAHWIEFGPADGLRSRETATNSHPLGIAFAGWTLMVCDTEGAG